MSYSISDLNMNTSTIVNSSKDKDVVLTNHRKPVAVLVSYERYQAMLAKLEPSANPMTLANLRNKLELVDELNLERPETVHKPIEF